MKQTPAVTRPRRGPLAARSTHALWVVLATGLYGCGGGGGGSDPPPPPPATFSPTSVSTSALEGTAAEISATITLDKQVDVTNGVYVQVAYDQGVFAAPSLGATAPGSAVIRFQTFNTLSVGDHAGTIQLYVCKDTTCSQRYSETAVVLSYVITISPAPPAAVVTPTSINVTVESGDPFQVTMDVQIRTSVYVSAFAVEDARGIFGQDIDVASLGAQGYRLTWKGLGPAPGTYDGTGNLLLCSANPCTRANKVPGSPIAIPYVVTVTPSVLLAPIPTVSGLPEWETFQGNAAHTGYVPVTLDAAKFKSRWTWTSPFAQDIRLSPVTAGSSRVVFSASGYFSPAALMALNESDGSVAWRHDFGSIFAVNHPATVAGRVFVASSGHEDTAMWSFDLATGRQLFRTPFDSQWEHYLAPVLKDGFLYTDGGYYGGMYAFRGSSGVMRWFANLAQYDLWSPAVDDTYAYAHTGYEWVAIDRATGSRAFSVPNSDFNWRGYALNIAPVIDTPVSQLVVDGVYDYDTQHSNHLIRYSVSALAELWRAYGRFASNPAVAGGRVYVLNADGNALQAYDQADGKLLWSWSPADPAETIPVGNVVVVDNLAFLSSNTTTYAVDVGTHSSVWSAPQSGDLAISSNTVLFIVAPTRIDAYDLR